MSARRFQDERGRRWEVEVRAKRDWRFEPLRGNPAAARRAVPPLYADDPFELSEQELRRILATASPVGTGISAEGEPPSTDPSARPRSPFRDDDGPPRERRPRSPFGDDDDPGPPPRPASPFRD